MVIYAFLLILALRPSWAMWRWFSIVAVAIFAAGSFLSGIDPYVAAISAFINGVVFCGLGALIVFLRLKFQKGGSSSKDKEIDAELARMRDENAARENQQPPA